MKNKRNVGNEKIIGDRHRVFNIANDEQIKDVANVCKALSSEDRLKILRLISTHSMSIVGIAEALNMPVSSVAFHIKCLEEAAVIVTDTQPGVRGAMRVCGHSLEKLEVILVSDYYEAKNSVMSISMPVGYFYDCFVKPTCGMANEDGIIGGFDTPSDFYNPNKFKAELIWFHEGFVEYRFPNNGIDKLNIKNVSFTLEICSEAPGYRQDWLSDISIIINKKEIALYTSKGDYGDRHGILTPDTWRDGSTQYGTLKTFSVSEEGSFIDGVLYSTEIKLKDLILSSMPYISFVIAVKEDAKHVGGVNIFGKTFGDYSQDIVMNIFY